MSRKRKKHGKERRFARRGIYVLPNLITTASLFTGFFAMISAMSGHFETAGLCIMASLLFDGLDGRVARATGATSRFGVEYDSLADLVAFGVAPAFMAYLWALQPLGRLGWLAAFLFIACGALRLARFNVQTEKVGGKHFVGLAIPAAAATIALTILFLQDLGIERNNPEAAWPFLVMMFILSFLMVSPIPYLSFKEMGLARIKSFNWLVAAVLMFILVAIQPYVMGFLLIMAYVLGGPYGAKVMARKHEKTATPEEVGDQVTSA